MIRIEPNALYSRQDLTEMLAPAGIDPDGWIARIKPVKRFRQAWYGQDLLNAINRTPPINQTDPPLVLTTPAGRRRKGSPSRITLDELGLSDNN